MNNSYSPSKSKVYKNYIYYRQENGTFRVNLPDKKRNINSDYIFSTESEVENAIDKHLADPCEYCNGNKETQQPLSNNDEESVWTICENEIEVITVSTKPQVFSCNIRFCPMCGRKLTEE